MKTFRYVFSDGHEIELEPTNAGKEIIDTYCFDNNVKLIMNGYRDHLEGITLLRANSHSSGDGFKPGWNPALKMEVRTNGQYQQILKEKGLIEIGNEKQVTKKADIKSVADAVITEAQAVGAQLSGNEISKIKGEIK